MRPEWFRATGMLACKIRQPGEPSMAWNPDKYEQFKKERYAPFEDLVKLVRVRPGLQVIDFGCGTGELTRCLADALPDSCVIGIDNSIEMLSKADAFARPGLEFRRQRIEDAAGRFDLIFSNAAIQWVEDHALLIPRFLSLLKPAGQIAVQVPRGHPALGLGAEIAKQEPFAGHLKGWQRRSPTLDPLTYAELLYKHGAADITVFEKIYPHVLPDSDAIVTWAESTYLQPYFERLPKDLHEPFKEAFRQALRPRYPDKPVLFGFKRLLLSAMRP
jgi:trans-aconitate 2-methyltransferase